MTTIARISVIALKLRIVAEREDAVSATTLGAEPRAIELDPALISIDHRQNDGSALVSMPRWYARRLDIIA